MKVDDKWTDKGISYPERAINDKELKAATSQIRSLFIWGLTPTSVLALTEHLHELNLV